MYHTFLSNLGHTPIDMALASSFKELASKLAYWSFRNTKIEVINLQKIATLINILQQIILQNIQKIEYL